MLRVILADDEKKVILLMQKLINWQALGYEVVGVANDGLHALELVEALQPHLLITDIRMPGCDGIELIRRARELQPKLHFIVISGYRQFEYAQSALKYGVEDYLLKPLKEEELSAILLRLKDKLGQQAALEHQLKKSGERRQEQMIAKLFEAAERQQPFLSAAEVQDEFGYLFGAGSYYAALVKPDIVNLAQAQDGYPVLMQHSLEIVRREVAKLTGEYAVALRREGIAVLLYLPSDQGLERKQCFTKIRKEIEKQRDLFGEMRCSVCISSCKDKSEQLSQALREALSLCRDRLCRVQPWRDAENDRPDFDSRYQMDSAQKKRLQETTEYLDAQRFRQELEDGYRLIFSLRPLSGQMLEDWFHQVLQASIYGLQQNGVLDERLLDEMEEQFWRCAGPQDIYRLLEQQIVAQIERLQEEKSSRETRPITEAKRYIQQHYQQALRLEDVSSAVGFNATYFSVLFKKETGQNFTDYLTELRINKSKELLCSDDLSIQDVAELVGYRDLKYFSRLFKKITGVSPSDYKKLYR